MLLRLDSISCLKTLVFSSLQKLVVNTLFQEMMDHYNRKDGFRETRKFDPYWKLRPVACMVNTDGVEIRIWSLSADNTQSWVRISHGSNKFAIDSNYNNTEIPADLPEEQASQLKVKVFAARSKAKAKPQRRELVDYSPSIIPMNERKWIDIEPGNSSLSAYEISKKVIHLLRHTQTIQREEDLAIHFWKKNACAVACREYTLPCEDESQPKGWIQRNTKIGPVLEVTTSYLHGKHGVEIRIVFEQGQHSLLGQNFSWIK